MNERVCEKLCELFSLENKVIVMTGAAGAIGGALAKGIYGASKSRIAALTRSQAIEWGQVGGVML